MGLIVNQMLHFRGISANIDRNMNAYMKIVWLVMLSAMAGCVTYQDRPLLPANTLEDFESRRLDTDELETYLDKNLEGGSSGSWGLPQLTLAAFFFNPQLDIARSRLSGAKGQEKAAAEYPNPDLGVTPGFNSTSGYSAPVSPWILDVALDIPIETAGKRGYRIAEARYLSESARLQIAQTAWELRRQVREALLNLYSATRKEALLDSRELLEKDKVKLLGQLLDLGEISANELSLARVTHEETRLAWLDENKHKVQARMQLAAAIGVPGKALEAIEFSFDAFEALPDEAPPADAQRRAMLNREDLLSAMADYQACQSALQREVARQFPDVHLGPGYEFDQSENKWSLGLSVNLPIFNQNRGAIAAAEARREEAAAKFIAIQAQIVGDIEQAVASYRACLRKVEAAELLSKELQATVDRLRKMYEVGEVVMLNVTAAELELNTNAVNRLGARIEALRAMGQLEDAMHAAADLPNWSQRVPENRTEHVGNQDHE